MNTLDVPNLFPIAPKMLLSCSQMGAGVPFIRLILGITGAFKQKLERRGSKSNPSQKK